MRNSFGMDRVTDMSKCPHCGQEMPAPEIVRVPIVHDMKGLFANAGKTRNYRYGKPLLYNAETIQAFQISKSVETAARAIGAHMRRLARIEAAKPMPWHFPE